MPRERVKKSGLVVLRKFTSPKRKYVVINEDDGRKVYHCYINHCLWFKSLNKNFQIYILRSYSQKKEKNTFLMQKWSFKRQIFSASFIIDKKLGYFHLNNQMWWKCNIYCTYLCSNRQRPSWFLADPAI